MKQRLPFLALGSLLAIAPMTASQAVEPEALKFGFPAPVTSYVNTLGMAPWIDKVEKASGGTLKIKLFAGPTLATVRDIYERTLSGVSQISFGIFGPFSAQFPRTQVAALPFLSKDTKDSSVALWRLYAKGVLAREYGQVKVLALFNFPSAVLSTNKPITTFSDLNGMKIAVSDRTAADVMAALGASPVTLTPPELYEGMSRGVVEGVLVAWTAVKTFRLAEVTKDHFEAPLAEAPAFVFMNKATYDGLPAKAKQAIDRNSGESFSELLGTNNQAAGEGESKAVAAEPGQSVTQLPAAQFALWKAQMEPVVSAWVKQAPDGAKVLAAYREALAQLGASY